MSKHGVDQCSICQSDLNPRQFEEITTRCAHSFHHQCAQKRLDRHRKTDCQVCRRPNAIGDALGEYNRRKTRTTSGQSSYPVHMPDLKTGRPMSPPRPKSDETVYITNLPADIEDNDDLADSVRRGVDHSLHIRLRDIKCYWKLGVGVIRDLDRQTKHRLVQNIAEMTLNTKGGTSTIYFVDKLELISYLVFETVKSTKDPSFPTAEEISSRWMDLYRTGKPRSCERLNGHFPHIYRLRTTSLDEILQVMRNVDFSMNHYDGRVYCCGDCSFLIDLPKTWTENEIRKTIGTTIGEDNILSSSFYIKLNKPNNSACIIVAGVARRWTKHNSLRIDDRKILKKADLTYRLLLRPVPSTFSVRTITQHSTFDGNVSNYEQHGENLILDLSSKKIFDQCIRYAAVKIENCLFHMQEYTSEQDSVNAEINGEAWYDTEMLRYQPDIKQFLENLQHVIFQLKWNAQIWLEQFRRAVSRRDQKVCRLLRMTVMLNTLGTMSKKSYMIQDREFQLKTDYLMKTTIYDHRSKLTRMGAISISTTPYKMTVVEVVKDNGIDVYERLAKNGRRPVLLQMTSWKYPGEEYQNNDATQEEHLFRQSDYVRSVSVALDHVHRERSTRCHCSTNGQLQPLPEKEHSPRLEEFGVIYTAGVTIFRRAEETGYAYMEKPLENVCVLTTSAYENVSLEKEMLPPKYAVGTRKKIANIFALAHHHKHDCLVLSSFACEANPLSASHVAQLFSSVIEQYAGFFKSILFAIPDVHERDRVFRAFQQLDGTVDSIKLVRKVNTIFGPYRILSDDGTTDDICICDLPPCQFGGNCRERTNLSHTQKFAHPPLCIRASLTGKCDQNDSAVHLSSYLHRLPCQYGGECRQIDHDTHGQQFEHPPFCPAAGACTNVDEEHLRNHRHLPLCKYASQCLVLKKGDIAHRDSFRHCTPNCPHRNHCADFHDKKHMNVYQHPFPVPCLFTPYHCQFHMELTQASDGHKVSNEAQQHCLDFAHVCRFGRNCTDTSSVHTRTSIHVARFLCPNGDKCTKLNQEEHLNSFTHETILDIRRLCKFSNECRDRRKVEHTSKFRHDLRSDDIGVVRCFALNNKIDFVQNQTASLTRVQTYIESQPWEALSPGPNLEQILQWIRTVQPIHRCNPVIFESIILHGHAMSRSYMENLKKPKFVANSVLHHSRIRRIEALSVQSVEQRAKEYITAIVEEEFEKSGFPSSAQPMTTTGTGSLLTLTTSSSHAIAIKKKENLISASIPSNDMDAIRRTAIEIARASIRLHSNPAGIGYKIDGTLGTDRTIFSVLGPHLGHYYGDVVIVFKREILHHPDAEFSIQAGTSFASGKAYSWRPWLGVDPASDDERIQLFHDSKFHASVPGYDYAVALELMAITSLCLGMTTMNIDLQTVMQRWLHVDSHTTIEAHLPQLVPLNYIDHIYMPKNIFDSLNQSTRTAIKAVFENRITITPHEGELTSPAGVFGPTPPTQARADYQDFVVTELIKRFSNRDENSLPRRIHGAIITIPPTNFTEHEVLPLRISQAYRQYGLDHKIPSVDKTISIYWQVMNGDMMLTLSNEHIDLHHGKPKGSLLVCYVAQTPEPNSTHYYEQASYLNSGSPFQHELVMKNHTYAASSHRFYVGCNTGDFVTFCLEIQTSTGKVTLSHAGSNSLYNREIITYTFDESQVDLTTLEFLHVSAGSRIVPVRNLIICFEKQADLHPTFDTQFNKLSTLLDGIDAPLSSKSIASLIPCSDNVNCLLQISDNANAHNAKYSHPCRFSELCRDHEAHLTHHPHRAPTCRNDDTCNKLTDPFHRAEYRHLGMPDFLVPCRFKERCDDRSEKHRTRYSHGEQVFGVRTRKSSDDESEVSASSHEDNRPRADRRIPCKWGVKCRDVEDGQHREKFSHPPMKKPGDHLIPCKWGLNCRDIRDEHHCGRYSHPQSEDEEDNEDETFDDEDNVTAAGF